LLSRDATLERGYATACRPSVRVSPVTIRHRTVIT